MRLKLCFLILPFLCFSQYSTKDIDTLLVSINKVPNRKFSGDYIIKNKKIIAASISLRYLKGEALGYIQIASALRLDGKYKECLKLLKIAELKAREAKDDYTFGKLYLEYAQVNYDIGLSEIAVKYVNLSISHLLKARPYPNYKKTMQYAYGCRAVYYEKLDTKEFLNSLFKSVEYNPTPINTSNIALYYISSNKLDSAKYYLDKSFAILNDTKFKDTDYPKAAVLIANGEYLLATKKYNESINNINQAIKICSKFSFLQMRLKAYQVLINIYKANGNKKKEIEINKEYNLLEENIRKRQHNAIIVSIDNLLNENSEIPRLKKRQMQVMNGVVYLVIIFSLIFFSILLFRNYKKRNSSPLYNLEENDSIEIAEINSQSVKQLMNMAKENNPKFLILFQEVYPDFCDKIKSLDPNITKDLLKFCALLKLGFSTKEIAEYTFIEARSVQTKKNRLRKQLNIASNVDLNLYMMKLLD
ncbi:MULTISPECIES: hypothetical protein [Elizabethkingia]|uniref:HTH luxR-type domain-containing protein n=1 Tax=Elizabethkingia ursingii TaxID=1756150 RepID=A0AAJ3NEI1_9FLAO|nr:MULTISPECIES: hypothetical protein [Elizabethkingia]AQW92920.1 hypothetical protein BBD30_01295 [Elizabethkingia anophelis]AQX09790.1 hypothetical protein BBD34_14575 [Elizabethkingia ursingii]OPB61468.1 hypothetical protein BAS07_16965 [Elizabethkingia anophelis]OPB78674.1 hypothetical protein BAY32_00615 [Elizabethkingia ursingii]OPB92833.1 hypothetical protein BB021_00060 [Elizabethkingia ursingii]